MLDSTLSAELAHVREPIATSSTLPPACYRDETVHEAELGRVFATAWVAVGRRDRWQQPGSYAVIDVGDVSVVVVAASSQQLKAYSNVCRHRGARLLEGDGHCKVIRCPFHRWTYGLDGRLLTAPRMNDSAHFDPSEYPLVELRVEEMCGFVFVCLDPEQPSLQDTLGDFESLHAPWQLERLITTRRRELEVDCNWKSFLEVFNEYYHLPYVHPSSLANLYSDPEPGTEVTGDYASQFGDTQGTGALLESQQDESLPTMSSLTGRNRHGVRYSWVFPNLTFAAGTDAVWVYETYPLSARRTRVVISACFAPETVARDDFHTRAQSYYERLDAALDEDIPALENQQRGLNSPLARPGRYCPLVEPNVAQFAFWYASKLRAVHA